MARFSIPLLSVAPSRVRLNALPCLASNDINFQFARYSGAIAGNVCSSAGLRPVVLEKMLVAYLRDGLLISQSDHGINARSATGWNVAGEKPHSEKHGRHGCKCKRVAGADAVEQAGHHTRQPQRGDSSNG